MIQFFVKMCQDVKIFVVVQYFAAVDNVHLLSSVERKRLLSKENILNIFKEIFFSKNICQDVEIFVVV